MNIIYARMPGYDWVSVPSDAVIREMEKLGHKIFWVETMEYLPTENIDFVFSPYESVTLLGDAVAQSLDVPHYAHVEVLPPWRVKENIDAKNYGLKKDDVELKPERLRQTIPHYLEVGKTWKRANLKSVSNQSRVDFHHKLLGTIDNLMLRYPSVDVSSINIAKMMYSPKREKSVITIGRVMPIKRFDILCKVMNEVKTKTKWVIIGEGSLVNSLSDMVTNENVELEILGAKWGWARYYALLKSHIVLAAMGGMPAMEGALCGAFPIVMEQEPTDDLPEFDKFMQYNFGDSMPIFKHTQITEAAEMIDKELNIVAGVSLNKWQTVNKFMTGKTNVMPSSGNAKQLIDRMLEYLKNV